jgi:hypothetical protein
MVTVNIHDTLDSSQLAREKFRRAEIMEMNAAAAELPAAAPSPLPAGWNMRDASAAVAQRDSEARLASAPSMTGWDGVSGSQRLEATARTIDAITSPTGAAAYLLGRGFGVREGDAAAMAVIGATAGELLSLRSGAKLSRAGSSPLIDTSHALQELTNRAVADLGAKPELARDLMSAGSYRHLVEGTSLAGASYGKAVERLTARYVKEDATLSEVLRYQSRPFVSTPDFFGYEGYNLRVLEITTPSSIPSHTLRPYGKAAEYVTHPGLPRDLRFPE